MPSVCRRLAAILEAAIQSLDEAIQVPHLDLRMVDRYCELSASGGGVIRPLSVEHSLQQLLPLEDPQSAEVGRLRSVG